MTDDDVLVAAQMLSAAGILWPGPARWRLPGGVRVAVATATVAAGGFATAAAARHGTRLTPRVTPHREAELLTDGPYAVSRHPIYTGLLVGGLGVAVLRRRVEPLLAWVALAVVLDRKTRREEVALAARFGSRYTAYRRRTPRLLPHP